MIQDENQILKAHALSLKSTSTLFFSLFRIHLKVILDAFINFYQFMFIPARFK